MKDLPQIVAEFDVQSEVRLLKQLINIRMRHLRSGIPSGVDIAENLYKRANSNHLPIHEKVILSTGLLSYMEPHYFSRYFINAQNIDNKDIIFGGVLQNEKFYPTVQTCLFLILGTHGNNSEKQQEVYRLFKGNSNIHKFIYLDDNQPDINLLNRKFELRDEIISNLVYKTEYAPEFDANFPAKLLETQMNWDDLVLPYQTFENLEEIVNWAIYNQRVFSEFKLGRKLKKGFRALFYGASGTGKTLTASLIGKRVDMPVYRIDIAYIVSKYVGETEKNLEKIFEHAENKNWILFFDEAESMFGKRTATRSSNDRFANQQVAYLLQRIEDFPGIIILASNKKGEMDPAFVRRFQLMLEFKIPAPNERLQLWQKGLNEDFILNADVDLREIAEKYEVTGGTLINILRNLSINALINNTREVNHKNIIENIEREFIKLGKTVNSI